jgi:hypothetical protein
MESAALYSPSFGSINPRFGFALTRLVLTLGEWVPRGEPRGWCHRRAPRGATGSPWQSEPRTKRYATFARSIQPNSKLKVFARAMADLSNGQEYEAIGRPRLARCRRRVDGEQDRKLNPLGSTLERCPCAQQGQSVMKKIVCALTIALCTFTSTYAQDNSRVCVQPDPTAAEHRAAFEDRLNQRMLRERHSLWILGRMQAGAAQAAIAAQSAADWGTYCVQHYGHRDC